MGHSTKQQHYIPQMILKRFYADGYALDRESNGKKYLWMYDKERNIERKVDNVKQICKEKNLYEIKDKDGNIVNINMIENSLAKHETQWDIIFNKIEKDNIKISDLLECEIKELYKFMTLQLLRMPVMIEKETEILGKYTNRKITQNECRACILCCSLLENTTKLFDTDISNFIFTGFLDKIEKKKISIFKSNKPLMLNTSYPIMWLSDGEIPESIIPNIAFPIGKNFLMYLHDKKEEYYDKLFRNEGFIKLSYITATICGRFIITTKPINSMINIDDINKLSNFKGETNARKICLQIQKDRIFLIINKDNYTHQKYYITNKSLLWKKDKINK